MQHDGSVCSTLALPNQPTVYGANFIGWRPSQARISEKNEYKTKRIETPRKYQAALSFPNKGAAITANGIETIAD